MGKQLYHYFEFTYLYSKEAAQQEYKQIYNGTEPIENMEIRYMHRVPKKWFYARKTAKDTCLTTTGKYFHFSKKRVLFGKKVWHLKNYKEVE